MLQHPFLLLGSFNTQPVSQSNIRLTEKILKSYAVELMERDIPLRFVSHQMIHIPDDVAKYQCGVETLSAFQYESFLVFFRRCLRSGNLPAEQIRNRLIERKKYMLPTTPTEVQLMFMRQRKSFPLQNSFNFIIKEGNGPKS